MQHFFYCATWFAGAVSIGLCSMLFVNKLAKTSSRDDSRAQYRGSRHD